jgi:predicted nucleic acid-binding protein
MSDKIFTLDTNILIYSIDRDAGKKHITARKILEKSMDNGCVLALQVLCEFYAATTKKGYLSHQESSEIIADLMQIFPIIHATPHVLEKALFIKQKHQLQFWDSVLWATAKEGHCKVIVTEDFQHKQSLEGLTFINPFLDKEFAESLNV